jgi:hypothetical protein
MLSMTENITLERLFTEVPGRPIRRPGRNAIIELPPREPRPPEVMTANIVINPLDPTMFPTLSGCTVRMSNDLNTAGILNRVIGLNVNCRIRRFQIGENRLHPPVDVFDIIPKENGLYAFVLPNGHYIVLRHIRDNWFRALAYFQVHDLYTNFLDIYFTNRINMINME